MNSLVLNQLFRKYQAEMSNHLVAEEAANRNYTDTTRRLGQGRLKDLGKLREQFASRGLTHSGINLEANVNLEKDYADRDAQAARQKNEALAAVARNRLQTNSDYTLQQEIHKNNLIQQDNA